MPKSKSTPEVIPEGVTKVMSISFRQATDSDKPAKRTRTSKGSMYDPLLDALTYGSQVITTEKTVASLRSGLTVWATRNNIKLSLRSMEDPKSLLVSLAKDD